MSGWMTPFQKTYLLC
uniref:Uncharacterized protein n=1 Tax=Arundo donax TaxID=35708 RepID=A0A0A9FVM3_ARUDO